MEISVIDDIALNSARHSQQYYSCGNRSLLRRIQDPKIQYNNNTIYNTKYHNIMISWSDRLQSIESTESFRDFYHHLYGWKERERPLKDPSSVPCGAHEGSVRWTLMRQVQSDVWCLVTCIDCDVFLYNRYSRIEIPGIRSRIRN